MGKTHHQFRISRLPFHISVNRDAVGHVNVRSASFIVNWSI